MSPSQAAELVAILSAAFPNEKWTEQTCEVYEQMLLDLDVQLAMRAVQVLVCTSRFVPTIAEIRAAAADVAVGERRTGVDAWGDVVAAIRRVGSYGVPEFSDPLTARAVRALGWRNLCLGDSSEASDRARFCEVYEGFSQSERRLDVTESGRLGAPALNAGGDAAGFLGGGDG